MTYDPKAWDFAKTWLSAGGWANEIDISKLAFLIEDLCTDFVADLEQMAEEDHDADR